MLGPHGGPPPAGREVLGVWARLHADLLGALKRAGRVDADTAVVDGMTLRAFGGGEATGPSPVDRGRKGTKQSLMVDRRGVLLAIRTAGANASDHRRIIPLVLDCPRVGGRSGRPKELPDDLFADRGYDSQATRDLLRWLGIGAPHRQAGTPHGSRLGKVRWVVERTISWMKGLRGMRVYYDRLLVVRTAWATLAASVICYRRLHDESPAAG